MKRLFLFLSYFYFQFSIFNSQFSIGIVFAQETFQRSAEAEALLQCFHDIYGEKIISGCTANVNWNLNEAKWVYQHTGKWPALNFYDFIHLPFSKKGGWIDYSNITEVVDWHKKGGIVGIMWHWNMPTNDGQDWTCTPGSGDKETSFDVKKIFEPESNEYKQMMADIDKVISYIKPLKQRKIPILWRPLHEAGGMWFWWGLDAEACNELWRVMYRRFQEAGLNNLIWVWTSAAAWNKPYSDGYYWYPGDDYVDIVGIDVYNESSASNIRTKCFNMLKKNSPNKLIALTECGNLATISKQWKASCKWLYFAPWYDYERTNNPSSEEFKSTEHIHANAEWWTEAFSNDYVLTRDDFKQELATAQAVIASDPEHLSLQGSNIIAKGKGFLYIYNTTGQLVRQHLLSDQNQKYNLSDLPRATYIIRVGEKVLKVKF
jgi:mannan endo-1,4-beta-mannosidase